MINSRLTIFFILFIISGTAKSQTNPTIASFSPASGPVGTIVTITGTNFNATAANNIVYFGAVRATVTTGSTTSLTVTAPAGATYQPISILDNTNGLTGYSSKPFITTFTNPFGTGIPSNFYKPKVDFTTGTGPRYVAIGDLDGDGKPDIVVANRNANTISVMRNISTSGGISTTSFAAKIDFATGTTPCSVVIGDVDGDGKPDLAVTNQGANTISILRNTSTSGSINASSFAAKVDFVTGTAPFSVAIGDVDGNGKPDLAVANYNSTSVSVLRNTSISGSITAASFATKVDFTTGSAPYFVAIGDADGDSKPDLLVANSNANTVSVFRNTSTAGSITASSFNAKVDFATGANPFSLAIGDMDGDGKSDIVVANYSSNSLSVLRNTSTSGSISAASFAVKVDFATGANPFSVAIGDVDGNGKPDMVVANDVSALSVLGNTSTSGSINASSFAAKVDFATGTSPYSVAIGDVDEDGIPEILTANNLSNTLSLFQITLPPVISSFTPASGPLGAIVTITGKNFNATPANNTVYFGAVRATVTGGSTTSLTVTAPAGVTYRPLSVLNNPIGLTGYSSRPFITTFTNPFGTGIPANFYKPKVDFSAGPDVNSTTLGDLDGDGKADMVVANYSSNIISVLRNTSTPGSIGVSSFAAKVDFATGTNPYSVVICDVDGDGKPDVLVANVNSNTISVLRNTSTPGNISISSFAAKIDFATDGTPVSIVVGDMDVDGRPDLVVASLGYISVLRNTSTPGIINSSSFAPRVDFLPTSIQPSVAIGDADGDGKPDIVVGYYSYNSISILRNTSTSGSITASSFAAPVDFPSSSSPRFVTMGDMDGDGKSDIVVSNTSFNTISVFRNTSTSGSINASSFAPKVDFATGSDPYSVAIGDADGDGKPDMVLIYGNFSFISVFRNTATSGSIAVASFAPKVDFAINAGYIAAIGDINGDGIPEIAADNLPNSVAVFQISRPSLPTDYFRTKATGTWNNINTWESSFDGINWYPASLTPDFNANTITILNGHTATVTANVTVDQLVINTGSGITVNVGKNFTVK